METITYKGFTIAEEGGLWLVYTGTGLERDVRARYQVTSEADRGISGAKAYVDRLVG